MNLEPKKELLYPIRLQKYLIRYWNFPMFPTGEQGKEANLKSKRVCRGILTTLAWQLLLILDVSTCGLPQRKGLAVNHKVIRISEKSSLFYNDPTANAKPPKHISCYTPKLHANASPSYPALGAKTRFCLTPTWPTMRTFPTIKQ